MKVLLVNPPVLDRIGDRLRPVGLDAVRECPSAGVYLIAEVLRRDGHEVALTDLVAGGPGDTAIFEDDLEDCDLVALGGSSMAWPTALALIRVIRERRPGLPVVCGGVHATLFDRHLVEGHGVDFVVRGEGERPIIDLCRAMEGRLPFSSVRSLSWFQADAGFTRNAAAPRLTSDEIAALPTPEMGGIPDRAYAGLTVETSRGCSFSCSFCSTPYRTLWSGVPAGAAADRIELAMEHVGRTRQGCIHIADDEFTLDAERAIEIARELCRRRVRPKLSYDSRASDLLHDGVVEALAEFTHGLLVGAECGYDEGLHRIGKGITCRTLERAAAVLARYGLSTRTRFCFILGLPWEGRREVEATVRFAVHLHATFGVRVILQWHRPTPGSRIWAQARRERLLHETMYDDFGFFRKPELHRPGCRMTGREILEVSDMAKQLRAVSRIAGNRASEIEYHVPPPGFVRCAQTSDSLIENELVEPITAAAEAARGRTT